MLAVQREVVYLALVLGERIPEALCQVTTLY